MVHYKHQLDHLHTSLSNQLAALKRPVTDSTGVSSSVYVRTRIRELYTTLSKLYTTCEMIKYSQALVGSINTQPNAYIILGSIFFLHAVHVHVSIHYHKARKELV